MSGLAPPRFISVEEYLAGEEVSPIKHEYVAGEVFAMAGANETHVTVAGNVFAMLRAHIRGGPSRVYISDMKLRVARAESLFYPDVFVTCDPAGCRRVTGKTARDAGYRGAVGVHRGLRPRRQVCALPTARIPARICADRCRAPIH